MIYNLISTNHESYYVLDLQKLKERFYIVLKRGRLGAVWPVTMFMDGLVIQSQEGYEHKEEALKVMDKVVASKINKKKGDRIYRLLEKGEAFEVIDLGNGKSTISYKAKESVA